MLLDESTVVPSRIGTRRHSSMNLYRCRPRMFLAAAPCCAEVKVDCKPAALPPRSRRGHWGADQCHHSVSLNPCFWDIQPRQVDWRQWRSRNSEAIASHVTRTFLRVPVATVTTSNRPCAAARVTLGRQLIPPQRITQSSLIVTPGHTTRRWRWVVGEMPVSSLPVVMVSCVRSCAWGAGGPLLKTKAIMMK